jgi:hypothetical protein
MTIHQCYACETGQQDNRTTEQQDGKTQSNHNQTTIKPQSNHNQTTIKPQSKHNNPTTHTILTFSFSHGTGDCFELCLLCRHGLPFSCTAVLCSCYLPRHFLVVLFVPHGRGTAVLLKHVHFFAVGGLQGWRKKCKRVNV